jgi:hypothetical protein
VAQEASGLCGTGMRFWGGVGLPQEHHAHRTPSVVRIAPVRTWTIRTTDGVRYGWGGCGSLAGIVVVLMRLAGLSVLSGLTTLSGWRGS